MSRNKSKIQKQAQKMTQEELQKTQVLNLQDFEEVARIEKLSSKKPAVIVAVLGIISIMIGTSFPIIQSLTARTNTANIEKREVDPAPTQEELINQSKMKCTYTALGDADGTDKVLTIEYEFTDDQLTGFTKTFTINPSIGNEVLGNSTYQNFLNGLQALLIQISGYKVEVASTTTGAVVTTKVEYNSLDLTTFPEKQQAHISTSVSYYANTLKQNIYNDMAIAGYICE